MGLDGGGGGGGIFGVGNPFTGPAQALDIYGDFAAAYSGETAISGGAGTANVTMLDFTTGNYIFVGTVSWCGDAASSADFYTEIKLNGSVIWNATYIAASEGTNDQPLPIIIPSYTRVEGKLGSDGSENVAMVMVGRIYR